MSEGYDRRFTRFQGCIVQQSKYILETPVECPSTSLREFLSVARVLLALLLVTMSHISQKADPIAVRCDRIALMARRIRRQCLIIEQETSTYTFFIGKGFANSGDGFSTRVHGC